MNNASSLARRYQARLTQIYRLSVAELCTNIVVRTPVDSGELRRDWTPEINGLNVRGGGGPYLAMANTIKLGDSFSLINAKEYAARIEYFGWSAEQAPEGMLRISTAEWPQIVARAYRNAT